MRNDADHRIRQGLHAIGHYSAMGWMKAEYSTRHCEIQDLTPSVFEQVVQEHPPVYEIVDRVAWLAEAQELLASFPPPITPLVAGAPAHNVRAVALAQPVVAGPDS